MSVKRVVWLLCIALSLAEPVAAQQPGATATLRGRVVDPQRRSVEAVVRVVQVNSALERETQSDRSGNFTILNITPGEVDVIVTATGFAERRIRGVRLGVGQSA